jgi:hypothetical protein
MRLIRWQWIGIGDRHRCARTNSDPADALVLADLLRTDRDRHRPLPQDSDQVAAIAGLARAHQEAVTAALLGGVPAGWFMSWAGWKSIPCRRARRSIECLVRHGLVSAIARKRRRED